MSSTRTLNFPPQKLSRSKKTDDWAKKCIDAAENIALFSSEGIRESYKNKLTNYNLANDILDTKDLEEVCNPMGLKDARFPAKIQNYPIANPKIDLLVGEERKRRFDWHVRVTNDDAISDKEEEKKKEVATFIENKIRSKHQKAAEAQKKMESQGEDPSNAYQPTQDERADLQELEKELMNLSKYLNYDFQDSRERMATHILTYLYKSLRLKEVFSRGFEDALIAAEEIYCADIVGGEPILRKCDPLNIHTVRSGESPLIDDADIIVEDGYHSLGQVIDQYYDWLKEDEIKQMDEQFTEDSSDGLINIGERESSISLNGVIDLNDSKAIGEYWDSKGNIRVARVVWKSFMKIGKLSYYDEEGLPQEEIVSEKYKADKEKGEEIKWMWINQWWEGTRIGKNIFVKIQPRPVQFRSMTNISKCYSGYTGIAYNINSSKAKSLMDRMKPYQYLYNVFMYRTELAFAKDKGKIATLDLAGIPTHWDIDKWMYYAEINGWAVKDSFKEANKGVAQGKLAGQMQQNTPVLDMNQGNQIQQNIMMLEFIERQLGQIAGVSNQRQGQIENRELVGNVERAVTQSSHITEKWFSIHNNVKSRALAMLLETAKYAFRDKKDMRVQYVLDDMSTSIIALDGKQFNESDYGLVISDSSSASELVQTLKGLAQAGLQNDKINFSQIMDIHLTESISSMRRKIERFENEKAQRDQKAQEMQQQMEQQKMQVAMQVQKMNQEHELSKIDREYEHKMEIERLKVLSKLSEKGADLDRDGIPDALEAEKVASQERIKNRESDIKSKSEDDRMAIERAKLDLERKRLEIERLEADKDRKSKEKIAREKPKATAK